jgi:hypothetical protein
MSQNSDTLNLKYDRANIALRRDKVLQLSSRGYSQTEISSQLNVSQALVSLDLQYLKCQAAASLNEYITKTIPFEFNKALTGITLVIRDGFKISETANDAKDRLAALELVMEAYEKRMELLTNSAIIDQVATQVNNMKTSLHQLQGQQQQQAVVSATDDAVELPSDSQSSIDYGGYDATTTIQKVEEMRRLGYLNPEFNESRNAKFGPGPNE